MIRLFLLFILVFVIGFCIKLFIDIQSKISYKFKVLNARISDTLVFNYSMTIVNNTSFGISLSNLFVEVFYLGKLVAKTPESNSAMQHIAKNGKQSILTGDMNIVISESVLNMISGFSMRGNIPLTYTIRAKLYGILPVKYSGSFTYIK